MTVQNVDRQYIRRIIPTRGKTCRSAKVYPTTHGGILANFNAWSINAVITEHIDINISNAMIFLKRFKEDSVALDLYDRLKNKISIHKKGKP